MPGPDRPGAVPMSTTLFISDLHLDPRRPAVTALFLDFLTGLDAACAALYILGDLFEAWIGDDEDDPQVLEVLAGLRAATAGGLPVFVMHGNRDFLLGDGFARKTGCHLLTEPALIDLGDERVLLLHGDTLCTDDHDYQQFRALVRDPAWQTQFLARSLAERRALAAQMRATSRQHTGEKQAEIMDVNPQAVAATLRAQGVRTLIHGHTHRPAIHTFNLDGQPARRIVLGDWYEQGSLLRCEGNACELQALPLSP